MTKDNTLDVYYYGRHVGTLAQTPDRRVAFQYSTDWIKDGFSISPFNLPLNNRVFIPASDSRAIFRGLFGVFSDSLPDAWGELLLDRYLGSMGIDVNALSSLDRLAYVGTSGRGALEYYPSKNTDFSIDKAGLDYDTIAAACNTVLASKKTDELDILYNLGGSSGGTRPKILVNHNGKDWIVKFPAQNDPQFSGIREYDYSLCAKRCGIVMTETELLPSKICEGYFMTERFDRNNGNKLLTITFAGLLEADFRAPSCDYSEYMKLIRILTKENMRDIEQMYRIMCFNVFSHNRDDHTKNFSCIYTENKGWRLAPAYDLTYSDTYFGEHTTSVNGKGKNIKDEDLIKIGIDAGLSKACCNTILEQIKTETMTLREYISAKPIKSGKKEAWTNRIKEIEEDK